MYDKNIFKYCDYFHMDPIKTVEVAKKLTNNYEDFSCVSNEEYTTDVDTERLIVDLVYGIYNNNLSINWEEMGLTRQELTTTNEITISEYESLDELYLDDGLKYSEFLGKYCDLLDINDKSLVLAVSMVEIGERGSWSSHNRNNFGGLRGKNGWLAFPTPEAGVIGYCKIFKNGYDMYTASNLSSMAYYYVGTQSSLEERTRWVNGVLGFYNKINENYDFYFQNREVNENEMDYKLEYTKETM